MFIYPDGCSNWPTCIRGEANAVASMSASATPPATIVALALVPNVCPMLPPPNSGRLPVRFDDAFAFDLADNTDPHDASFQENQSPQSGIFLETRAPLRHDACFRLLHCVHILLLHAIPELVRMLSPIAIFEDAH